MTSSLGRKITAGVTAAGAVLGITYLTLIEYGHSSSQPSHVTVIEAAAVHGTGNVTVIEAGPGHGTGTTVIDY